jgi:hypothetical protein
MIENLSKYRGIFQVEQEVSMHLIDHIPLWWMFFLQNKNVQIHSKFSETQSELGRILL